MTDYAKHIARFEGLLHNHSRDPGCLDRDDEESITAAIELMRAAMPKSPEDELRICEAACDDIIDALPIASDDVTAEQGTAVTQIVATKRAAARAEGYAQANEDIARHIRDKDRYRERLSAAQAEIERLRAELSRMSENTRGQKNVLETKRENLLAAVARYREHKSQANWGLVLDAAEASK